MGIAADCRYIIIRRFTGSSLLRISISDYLLQFMHLRSCNLFILFYLQHHNDTISPVTYCATTLNRSLLVLDDPLCHPSSRVSLPPALNQNMLGAVGWQDPQCTLQNEYQQLGTGPLWHSIKTPACMSHLSLNIPKDHTHSFLSRKPGKCYHILFNHRCLKIICNFIVCFIYLLSLDLCSDNGRIW